MSEWDNYGFPDPTFCPVWKCAEGLVKAFRERELSLKLREITSWDTEINQILNKDMFTTLKEFYDDAKFDDYFNYFYNFMNVFDSKLYYFIPQSQFYRSTNERYDINALLLDASGGDQTEVIDLLYPDTRNYKFTVDYLAKWLIQRKKALDLLKYPVYISNHYWPENNMILYREYYEGSVGTWVSEKPSVQAGPVYYGTVSWTILNSTTQWAIMTRKIFINPDIVKINGLKYTLLCEYTIGTDYSVLPSIVPFVPGNFTLEANSSGVFWEDSEIIDKVWHKDYQIFDGMLDVSHILLDFSQVFKFYDPPNAV